MAKGPWDVRFVLGKTIEMVRDEFAVEDGVTVVMAPGHAKAFFRALAATIDTYEQTYGEIRDPLPAIRAADQVIGAARQAARSEGKGPDLPAQDGMPDRK
jgi:hypothetical protein